VHYAILTDETETGVRAFYNNEYRHFLKCYHYIYVGKCQLHFTLAPIGINCFQRWSIHMGFMGGKSALGKLF